MNAHAPSAPASDDMARWESGRAANGSVGGDGSYFAICGATTAAAVVLSGKRARCVGRLSYVVFVGELGSRCQLGVYTASGGLGF